MHAVDCRCPHVAQDLSEGKGEGGFSPSFLAVCLLGLSCATASVCGIRKGEGAQQGWWRRRRGPHADQICSPGTHSSAGLHQVGTCRLSPSSRLAGTGSQGSPARWHHHLAVGKVWAPVRMRVCLLSGSLIHPTSCCCLWARSQWPQVLPEEVTDLSLITLRCVMLSCWAGAVGSPPTS